MTDEPTTTFSVELTMSELLVLMTAVNHGLVDNVFKDLEGHRVYERVTAEYKRTYRELAVAKTLTTLNDEVAPTVEPSVVRRVLTVWLGLK